MLYGEDINLKLCVPTIVVLAFNSRDQLYNVAVVCFHIHLWEVKKYWWLLFFIKCISQQTHCYIQCCAKTYPKRNNLYINSNTIYILIQCSGFSFHWAKKWAKKFNSLEVVAFVKKRQTQQGSNCICAQVLIFPANIKLKICIKYTTW